MHRRSRQFSSRRMSTTPDNAPITSHRSSSVRMTAKESDPPKPGPIAIAIAIAIAIVIVIVIDTLAQWLECLPT